jgi:dolichol-phosphate mannosyltransferase
MRHALNELDAEIVVEMDADFSHRPADLPRLVGALGEGADFVIGSRYVPGGTLPDAWGLRRRFLSRWGNRVARLLVPRCRKVRDCTAGFRAIRASVLRAVPLERMGMRGYIFQVALLQESLRAGARVREIPVAFDDRMRGDSKLGVSDIMEFAAWCLSARFRGADHRRE